MKSNKANLFNKVKLTKPVKSLFDLSHDVKLSCNMGELIPILAEEVLPGDSYKISSEALVRFAPLIAPIMHKVNFYVHYYFVPNRILWPGWENFITNTKVGDALPVHPFIGYTPNKQFFQKGTLADYLGVPTWDTNPTANIKVNALPFAAYQKIYDEYYRDQNLIHKVFDETFPGLVDGDNIAEVEKLCNLRKRSWMHDYFTSCLPFAQKGEAVTMPIGDIGHLPIVFNDDNIAGGEAQDSSDWDRPFPTPAVHPIISPKDIDGSDDKRLYADGTNVTNTASINDLRTAYAVQRWLEKAARGGTRLIESILTMFGVRNQDARLNRPEYICGSVSPVQISETLNTTGTAEAPQGNPSGNALSINAGKQGSYYCTEHGWIIGIMSVMPVTAYQDGLHRKFTRGLNDPTEYYFPDFANLGEQAVLNKELALNVLNVDNHNDDVFGYIPRYAEYKYQNSRVCADMRTELDFWHLGRKIGVNQPLNQEFIECSPDNRIFAVDDPNIDHLWVHFYNNLKAVRPMPFFGSPMP